MIPHSAGDRGTTMTLLQEAKASWFQSDAGREWQKWRRDCIDARKRQLRAEQRLREWNQGADADLACSSAIERDRLRAAIEALGKGPEYWPASRVAEAIELAGHGVRGRGGEYRRRIAREILLGVN